MLTLISWQRRKTKISGLTVASAKNRPPFFHETFQSASCVFLNDDRRLSWPIGTHGYFNAHTFGYDWPAQALWAELL